ncbi:hypothetical protein E1A91_D08G269600v1 [Gossypium mustelinum]|uniref:NAC domain-containing protein n=1 Tax=Gossypium mustelinum TaxID=34275 RepID=A0A5D2U2N2_GOSMU|nr:hypothetical protein E1A91_D08G269600v1 [Gossypium mustelinum]
MAAALVSDDSFLDEYEDKALPIGYRFVPRDHELISFYLFNKIKGFQLPSDVVKNIDFYYLDPFHFSPCEFKHGRKNNEAYYFTKTKEIRSKMDRIERHTRNGYWKSCGKAEEIKHGDRIIGLKRLFVFHWRIPELGFGNWVMHEFSLHPTLLIPHPLLDEKIKAKIQRCVICRIVNRESYYGV